MKKRKLIPALALTLALLCGITIGATASGSIQKIQADLDPTISVKYDGEEQILKDAQGTRVFPITYNGTTYLPIRAVAGLTGLGVDWDGTTRSVLLGKQAGGVDLIDNYSIYHVVNTAGQVRTADNKTEDIAGVTQSHWIYLGVNAKWRDVSSVASYNLQGKHDTLTFSYYADADATLRVLGDDGNVLGEYDIVGSAVPKTVTLSLFKTSELKFSLDTDGSTTVNARIFDACLDAE